MSRMFQRTLLEPLKIFSFLRFPLIALTVYFHSVSFGTFYIMNISLQYTFSRQPYSWPSSLVGFSYTPSSVAFALVSIFGGSWMDIIMRREAIKANRYDANGKLVYHPEDRMRENAWIGIFMYSAALICYGWVADRGLMWVAVVSHHTIRTMHIYSNVTQLVPPFFLGIGSFLVFSLSTTMLTEFLPRRPSSGVALVNCTRNVLAAICTLVAAPWIETIGNGWVFTIIAVWAFSSSACIWLIRRYGGKWRNELAVHLEANH